MLRFNMILPPNKSESPVMDCPKTRFKDPNLRKWILIVLTVGAFGFTAHMLTGN